MNTTCERCAIENRVKNEVMDRKCIWRIHGKRCPDYEQKLKPLPNKERALPRQYMAILVEKSRFAPLRDIKDVTNSLLDIQGRLSIHPIVITCGILSIQILLSFLLIQHKSKNNSG